jgi:hypothetical protein
MRGYACRCDRESDDRAVLVKVRVGQVPRDTSDEEGQIVKVDAKTARELEADGRAVRLSASAGACHAG